MTLAAEDIREGEGRAQPVIEEQQFQGQAKDRLNTPDGVVIG